MLSTEDEGHHTQRTSGERAEGKGSRSAGRQNIVGISQQEEGVGTLDPEQMCLYVLLLRETSEVTEKDHCHK